MSQHEHAGDEEGQGNSDVDEAEDLAAEAKDADGKQDGVAGLVGGKAVVVREGGGVLDARCEGQQVQLRFEQGVVGDWVAPIGGAARASWSRRAGAGAGGWLGD